MSVRDLYVRVRATGRLWNSLLVVLDAVTIALATILAYYARFEGAVPPRFEQWILPLIAVTTVLFWSLYALFGLYRLVLRYVGVDTLLRILAATAIASTLLMVLDIAAPRVAGMRPVPIGVLFIQGLLILFGAATSRLAVRVFFYLRASGSTASRRVLIVGAGSGGSLLLREIQNRPDLGLRVVGFLDDNAGIQGKTISGVPVLGKTDRLAAVVKARDIHEVMVAIPSAPPEEVRAVLNAAADANVETRVMPSLVVARGSVSLRDLRQVDVEDLLGREPTPIDVDEIAGTLTGKSVVVTGAAGSIGSELCRQIVRFAPKEILLIEVDESRLYELWLELERTAPGIGVMCICDIRDYDKLEQVFEMHKPDVVLHAAAYKHVPLMEISPTEAVKTNVLGTLHVIEACIATGVERFVLISTDKAVAPVNVMGLSKAFAERVMLDAAARSSLNAVAVRFGNVLGSRGSVIPIFEEQLRHGGPLTVTDPSVTRYFMTIPEAARLVLQAQAIGSSGDIFVLEMGEPVKISELARKMIVLSGVPADIEYVGLRPGEKLHETLVNECEELIPTDSAKIQRVEHAAQPGESFREDIQALIAAAEDDDALTLFEVVEQLEPGFGDRDRPECG